MKLEATLRRSVPFAFALALAASAAPAIAQLPPYAQPEYGAEYNADGGYDGYDGSGNRMIRGTVAAFSHFRLLLARNDQQTTQVDLRHGTVIDPVGTNIAPGMRVMISGSWSKGVFVADRILLRY